MAFRSLFGPAIFAQFNRCSFKNSIRTAATVPAVPSSPALFTTANNPESIPSLSFGLKAFIEEAAGRWASEKSGGAGGITQAFSNTGT